MRRSGTAAAFTLAAMLAMVILSLLSEPARAACPTDVCINVGEDVTIRVTSALLSTECRDSRGNPVHEDVTLDVSGVPATGGATATFSRSVIVAYETASILTIHTTVRTRPGAYAVTINGTGEYCGRYAGYVWRPYVMPTITGERDLWDFNGARFESYPTEVTLVAMPANMPPYKWLLGANSQSLRFPNGQRSITTNTNTVKIRGNFPTAPTDSPSVTVVVRNGVSLEHEIKVRRPVRLELFQGTHAANSVRGYRSIWEYTAFDQFFHALPSELLPMEIVWTSPQTELFAHSNWVRAARGPRYMVRARRLHIAIGPQTEGGTPLAVGIPRPLAPNNGTTKVDCWRAAIYLGGDAMHRAVKVDDQVWVRFRDHATTEGGSCP